MMSLIHAEVPIFLSIFSQPGIYAMARWSTASSGHVRQIQVKYLGTSTIHV